MDFKMGKATREAFGHALVKLGESHLSFGPPLGPAPVAAVRLLGEQVLPVLLQEVDA